MPPLYTELQQRLPQLRPREAADARTQPRLKQNVNRHRLEIGCNAVRFRGRGEDGVVDTQQTHQETVPGLPGHLGATIYDHVMAYLQHPLAQEGLVVQVKLSGGITQVLTRQDTGLVPLRENLRELFKNDLYVYIRRVFYWFRYRLFRLVNGRKPAVVHVDTQMHELVLGERQGQAIADDLHGPLDLLVSGEGHGEVLSTRGVRQGLEDYVNHIFASMCWVGFQHVLERALIAYLVH